MKTNQKIICVLFLFYLISYPFLRNFSLSYAQHSKYNAYLSEADFKSYRDNFNFTVRPQASFEYSDVELLFIIYFPIIWLDSMISGRAINNPFYEKPFILP